jgi:hypothetical protein
MAPIPTSRYLGDRNNTLTVNGYGHIA